MEISRSSLRVCWFDTGPEKLAKETCVCVSAAHMLEAQPAMFSCVSLN